MKKIVLDTNAYRKFFTGDERIAKILVGAEEIILPVVVVGELLEAFKLGTREELNRVRLWEFLSEPGVRLGEAGMGTAEIYADIRVKLHRKGKPIPVNDVWIAAQAVENGAVLISYDEHFKEIAGLRVWEG